MTVFGLEMAVTHSTRSRFSEPSDGRSRRPRVRERRPSAECAYRSWGAVWCTRSLACWLNFAVLDSENKRKTWRL